VREGGARFFSFALEEGSRQIVYYTARLPLLTEERSNTALPRASDLNSHPAGADTEDAAARAEPMQTLSKAERASRLQTKN